MNHLDHLSAGARHVVDGLSIVALFAVLVQWLPAVASGLTIIWTLIRIYETRTIQRLLGLRKVSAPRE